MGLMPDGSHRPGARLGVYVFLVLTGGGCPGDTATTTGDASPDTLSDGGGTMTGPSTADPVTAGTSMPTTTGTTGAPNTTATSMPSTDGSGDPSGSTGDTTADPSGDPSSGTTDGSTDTTDGETGMADPVCGNGILEDGEACDAGPDNGPNGACKQDCTENVCGDGDLGPGEACDDGNQAPGDGCDGDCTLTSCGDGELDPGEACDDGKDGDNTDECTDSCLAPACGDGYVQALEDCDLGAQNSDAGACTSGCKAAACGDGLVWAGMEACDDGDAIDDDECSNACKLPVDKDCDGVFEAGEYCFANLGLDLPTGGPRSTVVADFNGDGKLDFVAADPGPKSIHVRVGDGAGGFDGGTSFAVPDGAPAGFGSADIDGDGDRDLLVLSPAGVTVMINFGNAKFVNGGPALAGTGAPLAIAAADLDGDGDPDLATADGLGNKVAVRWGAAGTMFSDPLVLKAANEVSDIAALDMQGDGKLDLVALNKQSGTVGVYVNLGARKFARQKTYRVPVGAGIMEVADVSGDGRPDLLVVDAAAKGLYVRKGTAMGGFEDAAYHVRLGVVATEFALADVNHDGALDVLAVHAVGVAVATGKGSGTFAGAVTFPASVKPVHVAAGDLDGDGRRDLVVSDTSKKLVKILWSDAEADSAACQGVCQGGICGDGVVTPGSEQCDDGNANDGDDCRNDCKFPALVGCGNLVAEPGEICFSTVKLAHTQPWAIYTSMITHGDLNMDGVLDLALGMVDDVDGIINNGQNWGEVLETWVGTGEGGFEQTEVKILSACHDNPRRGVVTDYNKDGKQDVLLACHGEKPLGSDFLINVYLGNGNGTLQAASSTDGWDNITWSEFVDFDKDGDLDVIMMDKKDAQMDGSDFFLFLNKSVGQWGNKVDNGGPMQLYWQQFDVGGINGDVRVHVGDFNNDGFNDILGTFGQVWMIPGAANLTFGAPVKANILADVGHVADFNKDGVLDFAGFGGGFPTFAAQVYIGDGFGLFAALGPVVDTGLDASGQGIERFTALADLDSDGTPDLALGTNKAQISVALGDGNESFKSAKMFGGGPLTAKSLHTAELSGDSRPEVLLGGKNQTVLYRSNP